MQTAASGVTVWQTRGFIINTISGWRRAKGQGRPCNSSHANRRPRLCQSGNAEKGIGWKSERARWGTRNGVPGTLGAEEPVSGANHHQAFKHQQPGNNHNPLVLPSAHSDLTWLHFTSTRPSSSTFTLTSIIQHGSPFSTCSNSLIMFKASMSATRSLTFSLSFRCSAETVPLSLHWHPVVTVTSILPACNAYIRFAN